MTRSIFTLLLIMTALQPAVGADLPPSWQKPIVLPAEEAAEEEMLISVSLDAEVYQRSQENFADLRITDSTATAVPYLLKLMTKNKEQTVETNWRIDQPSLKPTDAGLIIEFSLEQDDPQPNSLLIATPLKNFEQRVRVYGLNEQQEELLADDVIFDYSQYMDVRRVSVPLKRNTFRRYRIVIDHLTAEQESQVLALTRNLKGEEESSREERFTVNRRPFRIDRIGLGKKESRVVVKAIVLRDWEITFGKVNHDEENSRSHIAISSQRQPLTELTLQTSSRNFSRTVHLEIPVSKRGAEEWQRVASGTISRFEFGDILEEKLTLEFPQMRHERYRLTIENRDSPPLEIDGVAARGHVHELVALVAPEKSYGLNYGAQGDIVPPDYDTAAIQHLLNQPIVPQNAPLGAEVQLSETAGEEPFGLKGFLNNPLFLGILIGLLALFLGIALFRAGQRVNQLPEE